MQTESAMQSIDIIADRYKSKGISFNSSDNVFESDGQRVGPQRFFTRKAEMLNIFLEDVQKVNDLDLNDKELLQSLINNDWEKFTEVNKARGISQDKTNYDLRKALKDKVVFGEVAIALSNKGKLNKENIVASMREVSEFFNKSAKLVEEESRKTTLGRIDRVMLSILPEDLATQSTFRNWVSCMHVYGTNHDYVDDAIGAGAIIAYGYDSAEPSKMISRLLILPYKNMNGDGTIAYRVNDRIYGKDNLGFRKAVQCIVNRFNEDKQGVFLFNNDLYHDNGAPVQQLYLGKIKLENFLIPDGINLSGVDELALGGDIHIGNKVIFPEKVYFDDNIHLSGYIPSRTDLSKVKGLLLTGTNEKPHSIILGKDVILPRDVKFDNGLHIGGYLPDNIDLSLVMGLDVHDLEYVGKEIRWPDSVKLYGHIKSGIDLSQIKELFITRKVNFGQSVKLPENVKIYDDYGSTYGLELEGYIPDKIDLSQLKRELKLNNIHHIGKGVQFPENVIISGSIPDGTDLSQIKGKLLLNNIGTIGKGVRFPKNVTISGYIPKETDLRSIRKLKIGEKVVLESGVKLPFNVEIKRKIDDLRRLKKKERENNTGKNISRQFNVSGIIRHLKHSLGK